MFMLNGYMYEHGCYFLEIESTLVPLIIPFSLVRIWFPTIPAVLLIYFK